MKISRSKKMCEFYSSWAYFHENTSHRDENSRCNDTKFIFSEI